MALALSVSDNTDGTGGVATVSGSTVGSTNTVYYATYTGYNGAMTWVSGGSRVSDGTITLALPVGYYQFQLVSTIGAAPWPAYQQNFTDVSSSDYGAVHQRILNGVLVRINQLALVATAKVVDKWVPRLQDAELKALPMIQIGPPGQENFPGMTNGQDDVEFPVIVAIMYASNQDSVANKPLVLRWREKIGRALRNQLLVGVTEVFGLVPQKPASIIDAQSFKDQNVIASWLSFGFIARQTRGLT